MKAPNSESNRLLVSIRFRWLRYEKKLKKTTHPLAISKKMTNFALSYD